MRTFSSICNRMRLLRYLSCINICIRLKYPHHISPSSPIPSCYIPWTKPTSNFLLSCAFWSIFPHLPRWLHSVYAVIHFLCFFPPTPPLTTETTREIYGPCVSFVERFLMFLRWHHVPADRKNKRPRESSRSAVGARRHVACSRSEFQALIVQTQFLCFESRTASGHRHLKPFANFAKKSAAEWEHLFPQRDNRAGRSYSQTFIGQSSGSF